MNHAFGPSILSISGSSLGPALKPSWMAVLNVSISSGGAHTTPNPNWRGKPKAMMMTMMTTTHWVIFWIWHKEGKSRLQCRHPRLQSNGTSSRKRAYLSKAGLYQRCAQRVSIGRKTLIDILNFRYLSSTSSHMTIPSSIVRLKCNDWPSKVSRMMACDTFIFGKGLCRSG